MTSSVTSDVAARPRPSGTDFRLPRAARLRRVRDIRGTMRRGRHSTGPFVDVFAVRSSAGRPRVAVVVPRHGRTAVARNRVRRRLSEIARTVWMPTFIAHRCDLDFIFKAKPAAYEASYKRLRESLKEPLEALCAR